MHNNLFVNRLIIYTKNNKVAYDETFHKGVNIIRGKNSSGKSTITHFLFYALGGAFNEWVKEAKQCSRVIVEVEVNGATLVLKRELNFNDEGRANGMEPMYIHWGKMEDVSDDNWKKYGFNTTPNSISFSNVLFNTLEIPIVKGDSNITMHQILRLIYIDQESPTSSLFLYEHFDTMLTRETVAELLLGIYNQELYDKKQRKEAIDKELINLSQEIKAIKKFIDAPYMLIPSHVRTQIENKEKEIEKINLTIQALKNEEKSIRFTKKTQLEFEVLNQEAIQQRSIVNKLNDQIRDLEFEIEDSKDFIIELERKLKSIKNSVATRDFIGGFSLEYCPECLSPLQKHDNKQTCRLCKQSVDESYGITQAKKIEQEICFQLKESSNLLIIKERKLIDLKAYYEAEKVKLFQIQGQVNNSLKDVKSIANERVESLLVEKGKCEGEILQFKTMLENAEIYNSLLQKEQSLKDEKVHCEYIITHLHREQEKNKEKTNREIEQFALKLLKKDLDRQEEFFKADTFNIDYRNNIAFITDKNERYSSSSNFYLKTSARYAIFLASLHIDQMRYPRFIFCDNMEDKGIEPERAHNFQRVLVDMVEQNDKSSYQLIYTTSHILKELDTPDYCVGDFYTETNKSLKYVSEFV